MTEKTGKIGDLNQMNNFYNQLKRSESDTIWTLVSGSINYMYPNHTTIENVTEQYKQDRGMDKIVITPAGNVSFEHKIREKKYQDFLLEIISNDTKSTNGWIEKDLWCHYFMYGFQPTRETYTFLWSDLKQIWLMNRTDWIINYGVKEAQNRGYKTISVPVPFDTILNNIPYYYYKEE